MQSTFLNEDVSLQNSDCLVFLKSLDNDSIDLVLTDPPYYQVKADDWDNQWDTAKDFLYWLEQVVVELHRVLKPTGSLFLFCGPKLSADTELLIRKHLNVLNHVVWAKPRGIHQRACKEKLRQFFPASERIVFAEHYRSNNLAYDKQLETNKQAVFAPIIDYFMETRERAGISAKEINEATGTQMCSHWFSYSQWKLPNQAQYEKLQNLFVKHGQELGKSFEVLKEEQKILNKTYHELKQQAEHLRRPFWVTKDVPYTDVWSFNPVQFYQGKHPCQKPDELLQHMILTASREGDTILDVFAGSGSTLWNAAKLNRKAIGCEADQGIYNSTVERLIDELDQIGKGTLGQNESVAGS